MRRRPGRCAGRRTDHGQATVELALLLPVVVVAVLLVVQVALIVRAQILTVQSAREAARAAAVDQRSGAGTNASKVPGLDPRELHVDVRGQAGGRRVHVVVTYRVRTDVSLVGALLPDVTVRAEATMRSEQSGNNED